ncbi:MAG: hypothetical protein M0Z36_09930 [Thermaerobacter sp.]|nr:hypothetical protein [Thermaerobacter sp.]
MPNKYYPDTDPTNEANWIVIHGDPPVIVQVPMPVIVAGAKAITAHLRALGFAVTSADDWHESLIMPENP